MSWRNGMKGTMNCDKMEWLVLIQTFRQDLAFFSLFQGAPPDWIRSCNPWPAPSRHGAWLKVFGASLSCFGPGPPSLCHFRCSQVIWVLWPLSRARQAVSACSSPACPVSQTRMRRKSWSLPVSPAPLSIQDSCWDYPGSAQWSSDLWSWINLKHTIREIWWPYCKMNRPYT